MKGEEITLKDRYTKKQARFRRMTLEDAKKLGYGEHVWFLALDGTAARAKVNGKAKTWKRDQTRVEVPLKYGLYEYGTFDETEVHRLLVRLFDEEEQ